ncbi:MAG: PhzF family phenazine biosynthesis protein, partial [Candidatus Binatia bacterium]
LPGSTGVAYRYYTCDVFTEKRFGGNPLAVLPRAEGLSDRQMQQIAREFNFSESAFVLPPEAGGTRKLRIFTPAREVPFAGHPNVGTAFVLAAAGELGEIRSSLAVTFEEQAGRVAVTVHESEGRITGAELAAPQSLSLGKTLSAHLVASAVSLAAEEIVTANHEPQVASVGLPFLIAELKDRSALARARADLAGFEAHGTEDVWPAVYLYTRAADGFDIRARMFAPLAGVPEDPATGSAGCALVGFLAERGGPANGSLRLRIAQGVEMGRPSVLVARAETREGVVRGTWVGGSSVLVSEGIIHVD